jgi:hypothetical protein
MFLLAKGASEYNESCILMGSEERQQRYGKIIEREPIGMLMISHILKLSWLSTN